MGYGNLPIKSMFMLSAKILGVRIDKVSLAQAVGLVDKWVKGKKKRLITTPNPEFVMLAQKDREFKEILNQADLNLCDGIGLKLADKNLIRVTGRELMQTLIKKGYKVFFAGGKPGDPDPDIRAINRARPEILFVGLGHGRQEKWIAKNLPKLKVKVAMGVGGAIDQLRDPSLVAPKWLQRLGLEWFYRLLRQPWRIRRQLALVKFLAKIYL